MKEFFAGVMILYLFIAFIFVGFGVWHFWTLLVGLVVGLVYTNLT